MELGVLIKLEDISKDFFPVNGAWSSGCFKNKSQYLCCNLRNNDFLAKRLLDACEKHNIALDYQNAYTFVSSSPVFLEQRHLYEQRIVKWQIEWIKGGGEGWVIDEEYGGDCCLFMPKCDLAFRKGVVDTLTAIGIDKEAIEEGLEKNSDLWREQFMDLAFSNEYDHCISAYFNPKVAEMKKADLEFRQAWLKMRKYEYYQAHKESVDKYGVVTDEMKMSDDEVFELRNYLDIKHRERMEYVDGFRYTSHYIVDNMSVDSETDTTSTSNIKTFCKKIKSIFKKNKENK